VENALTPPGHTGEVDVVEFRRERVRRTGCWPLTARVTVTDATVTWREFRTGHRDWDLSGVGPFIFDRHAYEATLATAYAT
jgi:hypothetical protein